MYVIVGGNKLTNWMTKKQQKLIEKVTCYNAAKAVNPFEANAQLYRFQKLALELISRIWFLLRREGEKNPAGVGYYL